MNGKPFSIPMVGRSTDEEHRAATPLELFFDLVFVVAIAQAAAGLHHAIAANHASEGLLQYTLIFFAIWWAWMSFTWFATSFDTDDVPYRLAIFVQLTGALILAAGVPDAFEDLDFKLVTLGYVVMRVPLIALWFRAGRSNEANRAASVRMAVGIAVLQLFWVALAFSPKTWTLPGFLVLLVFELAVPAWALGRLGVNWHAHHVAERYGLLTIIVLGESILAISMAVRATMDAGELSTAVIPSVVGGLLIVYSLWWIYFDRPAHHQLKSFRRAFIWGYGHYLIFAAGAAVGAGIAVSVDYATDHASIGMFGVGMAVAAPVAVFLLSVWFLHRREEDPGFGMVLIPGATLLILLTPFTRYAIVLTGLILVALVGIKVVWNHRLHLQGS